MFCIIKKIYINQPQHSRDLYPFSPILAYLPFTSEESLKSIWVRHKVLPTGCLALLPGSQSIVSADHLWHAVFLVAYNLSYVPCCLAYPNSIYTVLFFPIFCWHYTCAVYCTEINNLVSFPNYPTDWPSIVIQYQKKNLFVFSESISNILNSSDLHSWWILIILHHVKVKKLIFPFKHDNYITLQ